MRPMYEGMNHLLFYEYFDEETMRDLGLCVLCIR
jgi:hypothetical protein